MSVYDLCAGCNFTNFIVDIVVILVLVGFGFVCARRGFIECFFGFITTIVALLLAFFLTDVIVLATGGVFGLETSMASGFEETFLKIKGFDIDLSNTGLEAEMAEKNLPKFLIDLIIENYGNEDLAEGTTVALLAATTLSSLAVNFIVWVVLFIAAKLLMLLLKGILNALADRLTLVGVVNIVLGAAVGLFEAFVIVCIVLFILTIIPGEAITSYLSNSLFVGTLYNNNPLNVIIGGLFH